MYKIAVLGEKETVIGFSALGLDIFPVESDEAAFEAFRRLTTGSKDYAIIYVTESYAKILASEIEKHKTDVTPAVILIPGPGGSLGIGRAALDEAVEKAVGTNIL